MLPDGCNIMLNARQFWNGKKWQRLGRISRGGKVFLDSGGFVFFNEFGDYPFTASQYMNLVAYLRPHYYASLDYPCEPTITGSLSLKTVRARIEATVENSLELLEMEMMVIGPKLVPVIQGWTVDDYCSCLDLYAENGAIQPYMAVGSMCTRSNTEEIADIFARVHDYATKLGVKKLHAFGLKRSEHLYPVDNLIHSRDSAAMYFAPNADFKRRWGGKKFAPNRQAKREAVRYWLESLTAKGLEWQSGIISGFPPSRE